MSSVEEIEIDETDESSQDCIITRKHNGGNSNNYCRHIRSHHYL